MRIHIFCSGSERKKTQNTINFGLIIPVLPTAYKSIKYFIFCSLQMLTIDSLEHFSLLMHQKWHFEPACEIFNLVSHQIQLIPENNFIFPWKLSLQSRIYPNIFHLKWAGSEGIFVEKQINQNEFGLKYLFGNRNWKKGL